MSRLIKLTPTPAGLENYSLIEDATVSFAASNSDSGEPYDNIELWIDDVIGNPSYKLMMDRPTAETVVQFLTRMLKAGVRE